MLAPSEMARATSISRGWPVSSRGGAPERFDLSHAHTLGRRGLQRLPAASTLQKALQLPGGSTLQLLPQAAASVRVLLPQPAAAPSSCCLDHNKHESAGPACPLLVSPRQASEREEEGGVGDEVEGGDRLGG